jgi:hypothetical protein
MRLELRLFRFEGSVIGEISTGENTNQCEVIQHPLLKKWRDVADPHTVTSPPLMGL